MFFFSLFTFCYVSQLVAWSLEVYMYCFYSREVGGGAVLVSECVLCDRCQMVRFSGLCEGWRIVCFDLVVIRMLCELVSSSSLQTGGVGEL